MRGLFSKIAIESLLLDDAVAICQVEPRQNLVLFDSLVEASENHVRDIENLLLSDHAVYTFIGTSRGCGCLD